ncbi:hypothetical protein [Microbacterium sp. SGAir0570]|uniref:hypothetical protein n=1 Tax=Microbacterium sp. SGAir0570 TaxID=2070348 RepID=UPI0010F90E46|nr:hypothetical protein [Microbacterium sp. SGAir0570]
MIANIREQIEFIEASAEQFDSGRLHFAKMVAVNVRNLVHQTRTSHAMLIQAGVLTEIRWFSGAYNAEEENRRLEEIGSQIRRGEVAYSQSLVGTVIRAEGPPTHQSLFLNPGDWSTRWTHFESWWTELVLVFDSEQWSRKMITLTLANKSGGAHLDPVVPDDVARIETEGLGWIYQDETGAEQPMLESPLPWAVRTVADELLITLDGARPDLSRWQGSTSNRRPA